MKRANEPENCDGKRNKSELLPTGREAKEIVEVLAEMYLATHNSEDVANDNTEVEVANN